MHTAQSIFEYSKKDLEKIIRLFSKRYCKLVTKLLQYQMQEHERYNSCGQ